MNPTTVPMITDVTVRMSEAGDLFALEFEGSDGVSRKVALPVAVLPKLISGLMWAGAESAERRNAPPLSLVEREMLHDGARAMTDWRVAPTSDNRDAVLEIESGAAMLCVRIAPLAARLLGLALHSAAGDLN